MKKNKLSKAVFSLAAIICSCAVMLSCSKTETPKPDPVVTPPTTDNKAPSANPIANQTITLPVNTVTITGSGTDEDGTIATYLWTYVSGPITYTIVSPTLAQVTIANLGVGTYQFQLQVTDNKGATGTTLVTLTVSPVGTTPTGHTPPRDSNFIALDTKKVVEAYLTPSKFYSYSWDDINYSNVTHIVYSFLRPISSFNPALTYGDDAYEQAAYNLYPTLTNKTHLGYGDKVIAKAHANNVKVLIGVAGGNGQDTRDLSAIFGSETLRKQFVANLVKLCEERSYDGVTLDYEYPKNSSDGLGITNFAQDLRIAFFMSPILSKKEMLITLACPVGNWSGEFYDYTKLAKCVNWFSPMTYEYATSWTTSFSFNSPIYTNASAGATSTISTSVSYLKTTRGINPLQIVIGVPFFGWTFDNFTTLGANKSTTNGVDKSYTGLYKDYIKNMPANGFVKYWDDVSKQPYLLNATTKQMVTYDDENAIIEKSKYIKSSGLKGAMIWELSRGYISGANDPNPLLTVLGNNLLR